MTALPPASPPTSRRPRAWVLNVAAELELTGRRAAAPMRPHIQRTRDAVAALLPEGDFALEASARAEGVDGVAWCPTPRALDRLHAAGCVVAPAPGIEVLRRVNSRPFAHGIRALPGGVIAHTLEEVREALGRRALSYVRRPLGWAGRGARRITSHPSAVDMAWIEASLAKAALVIDPHVEVLLVVSRHAFVGGARGVVTVQDIDGSDQWRSSRVEAGELEHVERASLDSALEDVDEALREAGYTGPFNVEGFRYRGADGRPRFHPLSDVNARYSMGWPVGMGSF